MIYIDNILRNGAYLSPILEFLSFSSIVNSFVFPLAALHDSFVFLLH